MMTLEEAHRIVASMSLTEFEEACHHAKIEYRSSEHKKAKV